MYVHHSLPDWLTSTLLTANTTETWQSIANYVLAQSNQPYDPQTLHTNLFRLDRILAEGAWGLWDAFPEASPRTAIALKEWWLKHENKGYGRVVLVLDALSLRELPLVLDNFKLHGIEPLAISATGAEVPTDTNRFAQALGLATRSNLVDSGVPSKFVLQSDNLYTDVFNAPFGDCVAQLKPMRDIVVWHSWLDEFLHTFSRDVPRISTAIHNGLVDPASGFWEFIQALRQGRRLIITSDHGYANTSLFASDETSGSAKDYLLQTFHASRAVQAKDSNICPTTFMPPLTLTRNGYRVVLGQRYWKVASGYPHVCHGGLSLLEAFVPFIELGER